MNHMKKVHLCKDINHIRAHRWRVHKVKLNELKGYLKSSHGVKSSFKGQEFTDSKCIQIITLYTVYTCKKIS